MEPVNASMISSGALTVAMLAYGDSRATSDPNWTGGVEHMTALEAALEAARPEMERAYLQRLVEASRTTIQARAIRSMGEILEEAEEGPPLGYRSRKVEDGPLL